MREIPLVNFHFPVFVDDADYYALSRFNWREAGGYAERCSPCKGGWRCSPIKMHRLLANPPRHLVTDHLDGDPLNNQRHNLNVCTLAENTARGPHRRRAEGYVGRFITPDDVRVALGMTKREMNRFFWKPPFPTWIMGRTLILRTDFGQWQSRLRATPLARAEGEVK